MSIETSTLRHLCAAVDALRDAITATEWGFTSDHCENAIREIQKAMRMAIGGEDE